MTRKALCRISIDALMTLMLMFLMGYHLWGDFAHEWMGSGMFLLFIVHHLLNLGWHRRLFAGRYTPMRCFQTFLVALLFFAMLAQMYSGIVMSSHVFGFLPIKGGMALARRLHILGSHWGFLLMSMHLGLHWSMILGMAGRGFGLASPSIAYKRFLSGISLGIAVYGAYVFIKRDFLTYLFLRSEFVFLDYGESRLLFYLDYFALLGLWMFVAHYLSRLLKSLAGRMTADQNQSRKPSVV